MCSFGVRSWATSVNNWFAQTSVLADYDMTAMVCGRVPRWLGETDDVWGVS